MSKTELLNMFTTKSNEYFKKHESDLIYSLNNADTEYINFCEANKLFDTLITCYCANLTDDINWACENDEKYC